jgi:hypothetical protein
MLCKWRLLLGRKDTTGSSLGMAGRLCCTTGGEREVGGSCRIHGGKRERGPAAKGGREKGVLTAKGSDTKLRIIRRLNLMVSQPFLYICRAIYNSNGGGYHTRVCLQYFLYTIVYKSIYMYIVSCLNIYIYIYTFSIISCINFH